MLNMNLHLYSFALLAVLVFVHVAADGYSGNVFNVENYGAVGNGFHDNTKAFTSAWNEACKTPFATLLVPGGKAFVVNNIVLQGPCAPGLTFQVDGTILALEDPNNWYNAYIWLLFEQVRQFTLIGLGTIDGRGQKWWQGCNVSCVYPRRPIAVEFSHSSEITVSGIKITDSPAAHLSFGNCENVIIHSIRISSPGDSPNTDGIDMGMSKNIIITDSFISAGDDCVAFGNGCSQIFIRNIRCGPGHGISVGSLGKGNTEPHVSDIHVDGVKLTGTQNGVRIKTWQGGSGVADNIEFKNIDMVDVYNPIIIDQYYCPHLHCGNQTAAVQVSKVTFENIYGTTASQEAVKLACSGTVACTDIMIKNVNLKLNSGGEASSFCENAHGHTEGIVNPPSCLQN